MGGIAGIVHFQGEAPLLAQAHQLSAGIAHRGPDDRGVFAEGPIALVHRRFAGSASDRKGPLKNQHWVLSLDARLYSDDEVTLLNNWSTEGYETLQNLHGPFVIAAWHRQQQKLVIVRSAEGQRPIFWCHKNHQFAFCSEMPPLLNLPWVSRTLAIEHLAEQLSFRYVHAPRTLLKDIHALPAGHLLEIHAQKTTLSRWWQPRWFALGEPSLSPVEAAECSDSALRKSIKKRLQSDQQVGLLLSGGLDSSAILHHMCSLQSPPPTFTVTLDESTSDESPFAARVAKMLGAPNHIIRVSAKALIDAFPAATRTMGQPLPTAAGTVQYLFFQQLSSSIRVLLSGDGGDEVFGGRSMPELAGHIAQIRQISRLPYIARRLLRGVARRLGQKDLAASYSQFGMERSIGASRIFLAPDRVDILTDPGLVRPGIRRRILTPFYQEINSDPINEILYVWQRGWLAEDSLARADRMSNSWGIEVRHPMLDRELMQVAAQLPGTLKVKREGLDFIAKWPLREAMKSKLSKQILHRPKRTLLHPLDKWIRDEGADFLRHHVAGICRDLPHLFVPKMVKRLQTEHLTGKKNHGLRLWTLILFYIWWLEFDIDG